MRKAWTLGAMAALLAVPPAVGVAAPGWAAVARSSVVGTWLVRHEGAPFPMHLYVFGADGTVSQSNPDAGNARTSDSDGKGVWALRNGKIVGKWVELSADRQTHAYVGRGELTFELELKGDKLSGWSWFTAFDPDGRKRHEPIKIPFDGTRITLP